MKKVLEKTAHAVECYSLRGTDEHVKNIARKINKTCIISEDGKTLVPDIKTSITSGKKIREMINEKTTHVFVKGAVTSALLKDLWENKYLRGIKLIIEDGTKIFTDINMWNEMRRKGLKVETINTINVLAVTLNPVSPEGYFFDSEVLKENMKKVLPGMKIVDVVSGGEED